MVVLVAASNCPCKPGSILLLLSLPLMDDLLPWPGRYDQAFQPGQKGIHALLSCTADCCWARDSTGGYLSICQVASQNFDLRVRLLTRRTRSRCFK